MEAKDLMLGDWVFNEILGKCDKVSRISDPDIETIHYSEGTTCWKPIPVSDEIYDLNPAFLTENSPEFVDKWDRVFNRYQPKYVHELQHALRMCGINDLADNIIIE